MFILLNYDALCILLYPCNESYDIFLQANETVKIKISKTKYIMECFTVSGSIPDSRSSISGESLKFAGVIMDSMRTVSS
ncbi:hypothetical protein [Thermoplasma volcanium]|uniref:hypothetical protein n=1 Tax=Thermoplasma volcanium TaxID=50339 RepID=UPI00064F6EFE|nr:hypothetical protein [Thermoplasma volcanium]